MSIMFNQICINKEMLPMYISIYLYIYIYNSDDVKKHIWYNK